MNETVLQGAAWNLDYPLVHLKENVGRTSATSVKTCCNITFTHLIIISTFLMIIHQKCCCGIIL